MGNAAYQVKICDDDENIIAIIDNAIIAHLEWVIADNTIGAMTIIIPQIWDFAYFQAYRTLILERDIGGGYEVVENRRWFMLDWGHYTDAQGGKFTYITAHDSNEILNGYTVAHDEGTGYADKTDNYDDICKLVVTENIVSPVDTTRAIAGITVATGTGTCGSDTFSLARQNLLSICQQCANASWEEGLYLVFDMVNTGPGTFEMRTYTGQHGVDHTADSDDPRVVTLEEGRLEVLFSDSANYIYAGKPIKTAQNTRWGAPSKFFRRERYVSAQSDNSDAVQMLARAELQRTRPRIVLSGKIAETDGLRYPVDYQWGDLVSVQYEGYGMDAHITAVGATYDAGKETLNISVRGEL